MVQYYENEKGFKFMYFVCTFLYFVYRVWRNINK